MQLFAKFKKILQRGFRATFNFRKFKVALNPLRRILFKLCKKNQEKKCATRCLPLDRMLFQANLSQDKKRKRLLAVWVRVSRFEILYPV